MGLRDDIQADIAEAFDDEDGLADAVKPFASTSTQISGEYDPDTGGYPEITVTNYTGRGVFGGYKAMEADGTNILLTDTKLTALQSEVRDTDGAPATPKVDDKIEGNGLKYRVINVGSDPADASWTLQLRSS